MMRRLLRLLSFAFAIRLVPALCQEPSKPPVPAEQAPAFRAEANLVLVPTLVRDHSGRPVFALKADDFSVTDNGVAQNIALEQDTDGQPLALVVAIETGGNGAGRLDEYSRLGILIQALVGDVEHRVAVVGFDSRSHLLQDFSSDWGVVNQGLSDLAPGDDRAAIFDAVSFSVDLLRKSPPTYRRAILLVSETLDRGSETGLAETVRSVSDTNTIIYSLAFSSTKSNFKQNGSRILRDDRPGPPHGCMAKDPDAPDQNKVLQFWNCLGLLVPPLRVAQLAVLTGVESMRRNAPETIARLTGGEYYKFGNENSLEGALVAISNHVPNRYVLSFHPVSPAPGPHALEVKLNDYSKLEVTARRTYWVDTTGLN